GPVPRPAYARRDPLRRSDPPAQSTSGLGQGTARLPRLAGGQDLFPPLWVPSHGRVRRHLSIRTSVDLMIAFTTSPGLRSRPSAEPRVIIDTTSKSPTCTTTSAATSPSLTDLTTPLNWLRAL